MAQTGPLPPPPSNPNAVPKAALLNFQKYYREAARVAGLGDRPPPELRRGFQGEGYAYTYTDPLAEDAVFGSNAYLERLGSKNARTRKRARYVTFHELGHRLFGYGEGGANRFANKMTRVINRKTRKKRERVQARRQERRQK